jgi:hypothetical protein
MASVIAKILDNYVKIERGLPCLLPYLLRLEDIVAPIGGEFRS